MNALIAALPPSIISAEPFVPHTLAHLTEARVFPSPLPDVFYDKLLKEYDALTDVSVYRIIYKSDGLNITGVVIMPNNPSPLGGGLGWGRSLTPLPDCAPLPASPLLGEGMPILIYNRGGSREYGKLTLYTIMNTLVPLARKGYMVFASNYRGNEGGEGQEEFGGSDVNDVMNLLAIAREHPNFDGRNAFMIGHSRGGMMTTLAIKNGANINAAISIAGIADARKMLEHKNVNAMLQKSVPGYSEDPLPLLKKRTSLLWPEAITVPLLLLHGDNDKDVHYSDSVNLDAAITQAGGTSELVIYPTGSHALVRAWDDVIARTLAWAQRFSK